MQPAGNMNSFNFSNDKKIITKVLKKVTTIAEFYILKCSVEVFLQVRHSCNIINV